MNKVKVAFIEAIPQEEPPINYESLCHDSTIDRYDNRFRVGMIYDDQPHVSSETSGKAPGLKSIDSYTHRSSRSVSIHDMVMEDQCCHHIVPRPDIVAVLQQVHHSDDSNVSSEDSI